MPRFTDPEWEANHPEDASTPITPRIRETPIVGLTLQSPEDADMTCQFDKFDVAITAIKGERARQRLIEGFDDAHDDAYVQGELAAAATCYLNQGTLTDYQQGRERPTLWPWGRGRWKPRDRRWDLTRAGALYLAERDRVSRLPKERRLPGDDVLLSGSLDRVLFSLVSL